MEKINVLIVEDELVIADNLKNNLEDHNFNVLGIYDQGEDAVEFIKKEVPDLILMDIHLAGQLDGIMTAQKVTESYDIPIIYLSDHVDQLTVDRAKGTNPAGYLSKPYKTGDILRTLELAFFNAHTRNAQRQISDVVEPANTKSKLADRVFIRTENQTSTMVRYKDILYLEAGRAYCTIFTEDHKYILSSNMSKVFEQFDSPDFIKVHRSHIVNIDKITSVMGNMITLGKDKELQVSPAHKQALMDKMNFVK